jgi:gentisate 1,2-dioxygenase
MLTPTGSTATATTGANEAERQQYYAELAQLQMGPLWAVLRRTLTREPQQREVPQLWRWTDVRPQLLRAGELVTTEEAERRVLMFLNPANPARIGATATLYAAMQLILPGESARAHRHSPAALRFIVEGQGAYTCVDGEKVSMAPGDLVLTPPQVWHDHGNEGNEPVMWLDGLDIPLLLSLQCMFFEEFAGQTQSVTMPLRRSEQLYGRCLFPAGAHREPEQPHSPVWSYRWSEARAALDVLAASGEPDPFDGYLLRYANPATGGEVLPTLGCRLQLLPRGFESQTHRHTASTVYHVVEGSGYSLLGGQRIEWQKGDTFALPIWCPHQHAAGDANAVLFSFTDEPVLKALGQYREESM